MIKDTKEYKEGELAALAGLPDSANPYPFGTSWASRWLEGHYATIW